MYRFDLPVGAIIAINGNRYSHLGGGAFTGLSGEEIPYLVEAVSDTPELENNKIVMKTHEPRTSDTRYRVVFFCDTESGLAKAAD